MNEIKEISDMGSILAIRRIGIYNPVRLGNIIRFMVSSIRIIGVVHLLLFLVRKTGRTEEVVQADFERLGSPIARVYDNGRAYRNIKNSAFTVLDFV